MRNKQLTVKSSIPVQEMKKERKMRIAFVKRKERNIFVGCISLIKKKLQKTGGKGSKFVSLSVYPFSHFLFPNLNRKNTCSVKSTAYP